MMKKLSYAVLSAGFLVAAAHAEETAPASTATPVANFSGFYAGVQAGYGVTKADFQQTHKLNAGDQHSPGKQGTADGFTGGILLGWGKQLPSNVYVGLEAAWLLESNSAKDLLAAPQAAGGANAKNVRFKKKDSLELAARLGFVMGSAMPYVKVGFANSKMEVNFKDYTAAGAKDLKDSKRVNGFLVGAGIDTKVSQKVMVGLSYTFTKYSKWTSKKAKDGLGAHADDGIINKARPTSHNVMLRVAYTF